MAASSRRPPTTYGFNSDVESSPDVGSCLYSQAGLLAASSVSHSPEHYTVTQFLYATCDPKHLLAVVGDVQVGKRGVVRAAQGRSEQSDQLDRTYVAVATDEGATAHSIGATSSWRGAAPSRYIQFLRRRKGCTAGFCLCTRRRTHQLVGCTVASLVKFSARVPQVNIDYFINTP
jgi:hypothetical protein